MKQLMIAAWIVLLTVTVSITGALAQTTYRLKPGDSIQIEVLEDNQLNRTLLVLPDGSVNFPFAGTVQAGGRTVDQVQRAITAGIASNFASTPTVFVTVSGLRPLEAPTAPLPPETIEIFFMGEVGAPGAKEVPPGTTLLQAFSRSGGFSKFAATKRVQLRRTNATTGQQTVYEINFKALSKGARLSREIYMQEGDVVLVPERRLFE